MAVEEEIGQLLVARGWHLAVAETSTGGYIGYLLTSIPGSSSYFDRSIVAYSNEAKETSLAVPSAVLQQHGAVSLVTALAMEHSEEWVSGRRYLDMELWQEVQGPLAIPVAQAA